MPDARPPAPLSGPLREAEARLADLDPATRRIALDRLCAALRHGEVARSAPGDAVNLHAHTVYSYNPYGYTPSAFAWLARRKGLAAAGIVDFDVLDGVEEFLDAGRRLGLPACAGMETRVFVPPFSTRIINSPGEPGIAYHMGLGFISGTVPPEQAAFLRRLRSTAEARNRGLVERVNAYLAPAALDYDRDVLPLTPSGNATERHLCAAYARKAADRFPDPDALAAFWADRLGATPEDLPDGAGLQARIRARTMKRGGVGYVEPDGGSFPTLEETNRFLLAAGAIPTMTWLDGTSDGEQAIDELLDVVEEAGTLAVNIIPDRNFTAGVRDTKLRHLQDIIARAEARHLPIAVGTEMNSPGNRFVDDFESEELRPFVPVFRRGARVFFAHTRLRQACGIGYVGPWAERRLPHRAERQAFFEALGAHFETADPDALQNLPEDPDPGALLAKR